MTKEDKYNRYFMDVALRTAQNSYAVRCKVGSVIVKDSRIISSGWNGTPPNFDNCCESTLADGSLVTNPNVIHSEANAIYFCAKHGIKTDNASLYITLSPCATCALAIIQAGIKKVYYHERYRDDTGIRILEEAGVEVNEL